MKKRTVKERKEERKKIDAYNFQIIRYSPTGNLRAKTTSIARPEIQEKGNHKRKINECIDDERLFRQDI